MKYNITPIHFKQLGKSILFVVLCCTAHERKIWYNIGWEAHMNKIFI